MHQFAVLPRLLLSQASGGIFEGELYRRLDPATSDEHGRQTLGISGAGLHLAFVRQWPGRMSLMLVGACVSECRPVQCGSNTLALALALA